MAFAFVNPLSALWESKGLRYILENECLRSQQQEDSPVAAAASQTVAGKDIRPESKWSGRPARVPQPAAQDRGIAPQETRPSPEAWRPLPVMDWPREWRMLFQTTRKGLFAWTYFDLGADIASARSQGGTTDDTRRQRSQLIRKVLGDLGHPAGTHTFWPLRLGSRDEAEGELFWSGAHALGCRGVVIMGSRAALPLLQRKGLRPLTQLRHRGQLVWILEDLDRICASETSYARMLTFLRREMQLVLRRRAT